MVKKAAVLMSIWLIVVSCDEGQGPGNGLGLSGNQPAQLQGEWLIPLSEVIDGGPGKDGIPALVDPNYIPVSEASWLADDDLVLGFTDGMTAVAYPHQILNWHEIINDEVNGFNFAVTYCPLTGTGIGWERKVDNKLTSFGVSGLIYRNNLIPYDRRTDSNWSQIRRECINGELITEEISTFPLVETKWKTWKEMYPSTKVVGRNTGYDRAYDEYPYGDYLTDQELIFFPIGIDDRRLERKDRVHGIVINDRAKVYQFDLFESTIGLINDEIDGEEVIIVGNKSRNFIVSFYSTLKDGTKPIFRPSNNNRIILEDDLGNEWDIFGYAVSGPNMGSQLRRTESFMGYWFSWGAFYPEPEIYSK